MAEPLSYTKIGEGMKNYQWWIQILKQLGEDRNTHPVPNIMRGRRLEIFFLLVLQTSVWPKIRRLQLTPTFSPYRPRLRFPTGTLGKIILKATLGISDKNLP